MTNIDQNHELTSEQKQIINVILVIGSMAFGMGFGAGLSWLQHHGHPMTALALILAFMYVVYRR